MKKFLTQPVLLTFTFLFSLSLVFLWGCQKTQDMQITCEVKSLGATKVIIHSTLSPAISGTAVQLTITKGDTVIDKFNRLHGGDNDFTFTNLKASTTYLVEIKIINNSSIKAQPCTTSVVTLISDAPVLNTSSATNSTPVGADVGGVVTFESAQMVTESGVCWSTAASPAISGYHIALSSGVSSFTTTLTGLNGNTKYHFRAYAKSGTSVYYGGDSTFTTLPTPPSPPTVTTTIPNTVAYTTASTGGNVTNGGTASVTIRGVCFGVSANPDVTGTKTNNGPGTGNFITNLSGLLSGTTYHVRAYATNSVGTSYGADETLTTLTIVIPTVTTTTPANITQTTANAGGNVTSSGGGVISALGVCYGTSPNPDLTGSFTNNGAGTGSFTSPLTGLLPGTTYTVRAYATNSAGTGYGSNVSFTTLP